MKTLIKNTLLVSAVLLFLLPESLSALPGFSRQTGKACMACHSQNIPKLNSYGREFALSGYTIYSDENQTQPLIEGSEVPLGLASNLNASAVLKVRYVKMSQNAISNPSEVGIGRGEIQVREGSGIYFGGRVADNFGGLASIKINPNDANDAMFDGKFILSYPALNGYGGLSLISTPKNGIFSALETYNTGLNAPIAQFENSYVTNAAQATGVGNGPATGLQAYYGNSSFFITAGFSVPAQNSDGLDAGASLLPFARISYAQPISNWNFMLGAYGFSGDVKANDESLNGLPITSGATLVNVNKEAYGLDFEANGNFSLMSVMLTANYVAKNVVDVDPAILTSNNLQKTDNSAASIEAQINLDKYVGIKAAYMQYANNDDTTTSNEFIKNYDYTSYTLGVSVTVRENIAMSVEYSTIKPMPATIGIYKNAFVTATLAF